MKITWKVLPRRKFDAMMKGFGLKPRSSDALHTSQDGIAHTIYILPHASTNERLHELGHSMLGHCDKNRKTYGDAVRMEIEAEAYRYSKLGKPLTWEIAYGAIWLFIGDGGARPGETLNVILKNLRNHMTITLQAKSELWKYIKDYHKEYKIEKREGRLNW